MVNCMVKHAIIALLLVGLVPLTSPSAAVCFLADKEDAVTCNSDGEETCCVIVYRRGGLTCFEGWCASVATCAWEQVIRTLCGGPGLDIDAGDPDRRLFNSWKSLRAI